MENMKHKIIAVLDENNIVTRVLDYSLLDTVKDQNYKIYSSMSDISRGMHIDNYTDEGKILLLSERIEKGLFEVPEGKTLDVNATGGEYLRDKNEVEKYKDDPKSETNILKTLDTHEGQEYIRDKTMLEKYDEGLATKDEYNAYQKEQRNTIFESTLDKELTILDNELKRGEITQAEYDEGFAAYMEAVEAVREQYQYIQ